MAETEQSFSHTQDFSYAPTAAALAERSTTADPSAMGGQVKHFQDDDFNPEDIAAIKAQVKEETDGLIEAEVEELYEHIIGGKEAASKGSVWDAFRKGYTKQSSDKIYGMVDEAKVVGKGYGDGGKLVAQRDVFDKVVAAVASDIHGRGPGFYIRAENSNFIEIGAGLEEIADSSEIQDPVVLDKATETIHLLVEVGVYKLQSLTNPRQLNAALDLLAEFTKKVPDFDPRAAGLVEAYMALVVASAAVKIDVDTKRHQSQDHMHHYRKFQDSLDKIADVVAYDSLRNDVGEPVPA